MARHLDTNVRGIYKRRRNLEEKYNRQITGPGKYNTTRNAIKHPQRIYHEIQDGVVLIGSDAHYWPNIITPAHRAFVKFCGDYDPKVIIMNGDVIDGSSISRFPVGWEHRPTVAEEIETAQERLEEIQKAAPNAKRYWPLGNHDARLETRIATVAPELIKLHGVHLKDHFPYWEPCFAVWLNGNDEGDKVVVKHNWKGGIHAPHNNTILSGVNIVTGHLHSLRVSPWSDYADRPRYGVDCGMLADPYGEQFLYAQDNPRNHRAGFVMLTFRDGRLMWPEIIHVLDDDHVEFRTEIIPI